MPYLVAGVVFVGVLCAFDLILTVAVVRRLRVHAALLEGERSLPPLTPPGTRLPEFHGDGVDGATVTRAFFSGPTIVGLFSTTCGSCRERLPEFAGRLRALGDRRALAVVVGEDRDAAEPFVADLSPVATVVVEPEGGPVSAAFGYPAYPSFYIVNADAEVTASTLTLDGLPVPASK
ncbi:redoxin domain-containing protein [Spirillospora sp. NBC_00431]